MLEDHRAARLCYPSHLADSTERIVTVIEGVARMDDVELPTVKELRQALGLALTRPDRRIYRGLIEQLVVNIGQSIDRHNGEIKVRVHLTD